MLVLLVNQAFLWIPNKASGIIGLKSWPIKIFHFRCENSQQGPVQVQIEEEEGQQQNEALSFVVKLLQEEEDFLQRQRMGLQGRQNLWH